MNRDQQKISDVGLGLFSLRWQARFAEMIGLPASRISMMMLGHRPIPGDIDALICAGLCKRACELEVQLATVHRWIARLSKQEV